jgi:starch-binding outer membrane protein, SusD/RagB family
MRYIMAECYARKNQFAEAYEILNEIRKQYKDFHFFRF